MVERPGKRMNRIEQQPQSRIRAVIFDVDGTMIRSEGHHVAAWEQSVIEQHSSLPSHIRGSMTGRRPVDIAAQITSDLSLSISADELLQRKTALFMQRLSKHVEEVPGLSDAVRKLNASGYRLAIGTSMSSDYVKLVLDKLQLTDMFAVIVTGEQVTHGKPDPETYATAVNKLGLQPSECLVIEDATNGIASAKAAGCLCIAIEDNVPEAVKQDISHADAIISSYAQLPDVLNQFNEENRKE